MRRKDREVTSKDEMNSILQLCRTCHVAMLEEDRPYIIPLSYGYKFEGDYLILYFHSAKEGKKIDVLIKNNVVGFAISDEGELILKEIPCDSGYYFSSIVGTGEVIFIEEIEEKCEALSLIFERQTERKVSFNKEQAQGVLVYKLISKEFTGKRKAR